MGALIQQYHEIRARRLALQREADTLEQQEKDLLYDLTMGLDIKRGHLVNEGQYQMKAAPKQVVVVEAWSVLLNHIRDTGEVDLLQKRVTESAVKERWGAGLTVPGTKEDNKWVVTVTKLE